MFKIKNDFMYKCHNCGVGRTFSNFLKELIHSNSNEAHLAKPKLPILCNLGNDFIDLNVNELHELKALLPISSRLDKSVNKSNSNEEQ